MAESKKRTRKTPIKDSDAIEAEAVEIGQANEAGEVGKAQADAPGEAVQEPIEATPDHSKDIPDLSAPVDHPDPEGNAPGKAETIDEPREIPPFDPLPEEEPAAQHAEPEVEGETPPSPSESTPHEDDFSRQEPAAAPRVVRKGGFWPMLFGGVLAALIGLGAARYVLPQDWLSDGAEEQAFASQTAARLDAQEETIAALKAEIAQATDNSAIETRLNDLSEAQSTTGEALSNLSQTITALETRLSDLEKRPVTTDASEAAVAAYERELKALQDAMAAQRAEVEAKQQSVAQTSQETLRRAAFSRIETALETGTSYAAPLGDLQAEGIDVPAPLSDHAANGVASQVDLETRFPAAARNALAAARAEDANSGIGGFSAFLLTQLGARSLEPREGSDPDAILSRAEAALSDGRLGDTLAELEQLPDVARSEMTQWMTDASTRFDALAAAETLGQQLNPN